MTENNPIERADVEMIFGQMRDDDIDPEAEHVWAYHFLAETSDGLEEVAEELSGRGYSTHRIVSSDDESVFWLEVRRHESHTVDSLDERNEEFHDLADEHDVSYDGFDVQP